MNLPSSEDCLLHCIVLHYPLSGTTYILSLYSAAIPAERAEGAFGGADSHLCTLLSSAARQQKERERKREIYVEKSLTNEGHII
jgi:hypothetical protein